MSGQGKSRTLEDLGVTQVEVISSRETPKAQTCRAGIVAAMALALGCTLGSPEAQAAGLDGAVELTRLEAASISAQAAVGIHRASMSTTQKALYAGGDLALNALTGDIESALINTATEVVAAGAAGGATKNPTTGWLTGEAVAKTGLALSTGSPIAALSAVSSALDLGNHATGFDEKGTIRRTAESAFAIGGAILVGGPVGLAYAGKTVYDNVKTEIAVGERDMEKRAEIRDERLTTIQQEERMAIWNAEREARQAWDPALRDFDQQRMLKLANEEYTQAGMLTSPEAERRYGIEAQREADGLPVEPWYAEHQAFREQREMEMQRQMDAPDMGGFHG